VVCACEFDDVSNSIELYCVADNLKCSDPASPVAEIFIAVADASVHHLQNDLRADTTGPRRHCLPVGSSRGTAVSSRGSSRLQVVPQLARPTEAVGLAGNTWSDDRRAGCGWDSKMEA
jgi:hypothetical protein